MRTDSPANSLDHCQSDDDIDNDIPCSTVQLATDRRQGACTTTTIVRTLNVHCALLHEGVTLRKKSGSNTENSECLSSLYGISPACHWKPVALRSSWRKTSSMFELCTSCFSQRPQHLKPGCCCCYSCRKLKMSDGCWSLENIIPFLIFFVKWTLLYDADLPQECCKAHSTVCLSVLSGFVTRQWKVIKVEIWCACSPR